MSWNIRWLCLIIVVVIGLLIIACWPISAQAQDSQPQDTDQIGLRVTPQEHPAGQLVDLTVTFTLLNETSESHVYTGDLIVGGDWWQGVFTVDPKNSILHDEQLCSERGCTLGWYIELAPKKGAKLVVRTKALMEKIGAYQVASTPIIVDDEQVQIRFMVYGHATKREYYLPRILAQ